MPTDNPTKKVLVLVLIAILFIVAFLIVTPILKAIIAALIGAYIFYPFQKKLVSKIKYKNLSALIITLSALLLIIIPLVISLPLIVKQAFNIYTIVQNVDFTSYFSKYFPQIFTSEISSKITFSLNSFILKIANSAVTNFANLLVNLPALLLNIALIIFTFFFVIRDMDKLKVYLSSLSPFTLETQKEFLNKSKDVTQAVLYGHVVTGVIQGLITGLGLFIFGVPNSLTLTFLAIIASVIPVIGPWLVWFPVSLFLIISGDTFAGFGLLIYGLAIISWIDNVIRVWFISWRTSVNSGLVLIGMIGGYLALGVLGLILGPLVIAYLLLVLDMYRNKKFDIIFFSRG